MKYISIDGDDVGQKITNAYLRNNVTELIKINNLIQEKIQLIAEELVSEGFSIIFCAADGVAAHTKDQNIDEHLIYDKVKSIAGEQITFSAGVGSSLRDAYIALLSAKSSGKSRMHNFNELQ